MVFELVIDYWLKDIIMMSLCEMHYFEWWWLCNLLKINLQVQFMLDDIHKVNMNLDNALGGDARLQRLKGSFAAIDAMIWSKIFYAFVTNQNTIFFFVDASKH